MRDGGMLTRGACLCVCLAVGATAFGATGRILLPGDASLNPHVIQTEPDIKVWVDLNPLTTEMVVFEVVVDSSATYDAWGYEWQIGVDGNGLELDPIASAGLTQGIADDGDWDPRYLLFEDSSDVTASLSDKGIRLGDLAHSMTTYLPEGKSLGLVVINIADEQEAMGVHTVVDPFSFLHDLYLGKEPLELEPIQFTVVPEPCTILLLSVGLVGLKLRRRR